jgi:D-xylose transport system substrate-binding protein
LEETPVSYRKHFIFKIFFVLNKISYTCITKKCINKEVMRYWAILLIFISLLSSCVNRQKVKIAMFFPHLNDERYQKEKEYFSNKVIELGGEPLIFDANRDQKLQINQVSEAISNGAKVLVVDAVNVNLAAVIVRLAHSKHIPVIAYDRLIINADINFYISFKYQMIGRLMTQYALKLKPTGNYILIGGDRTDFNALQIDKGQLEALNPSIIDGKIKLLYKTYIEDWSTEMAAHETNYFLQLSDETPDIILASSDKLATGVIQTLDKYNLTGKIIVTGMDANKTACKRIIKNSQTMSVYKPFRKLAITAAEVAMKFSKGEKVDPDKDSFWNGAVQIPTILLEPVVVDKNSIKSTVIADGFYTENEIYSDEAGKSK